MCRWFGLYFHDWVDYNGVAFLMESLEWGMGSHNFFIFWKGSSSYLRLANAPEFLYCRWKVKCYLFNLRNQSFHFRMTY